MNKKRLTLIIFIILVIVITSCVVCINIDENENRFHSTLSEYDKEYKHRIMEYEKENILRCYSLDDDEIGFVVYSQGYENVILLFAVLDNIDIKQVKILYHNESEDYGEYVDEDWFLSRLMIPYSGQLETVTVSREKDNQIVAITGATITSEAVVDAINKCINIIQIL